MASLRAVPVLPLLLALACTAQPQEEAAPPTTEVATPPATAPDLGTPEGKMASAQSAAPSGVSANATLAEIGADGQMHVLKEGSNGWVCVADIKLPDGKAQGPMCADSQWQSWFQGYMERTPPKVTALGVSYMEKGGATASNTDPFAETPGSGGQWIDDGPHLMIVVPDPKMLDGFPTDPASGQPYVMWKGTPYAHLMVPISGN